GRTRLGSRAEVDDNRRGPDRRITMSRVELTADELALILELEEEAAPQLLNEDTTAPYELPGDLGDRMEAALDQIARAHAVDPAAVQAHVDPRSKSAWVTVESSPSEHAGTPAPSVPSTSSDPSGSTTAFHVPISQAGLTS